MGPSGLCGSLETVLKFRKLKVDRGRQSGDNNAILSIHLYVLRRVVV